MAASCGGGGAASLSLRPRRPPTPVQSAVQASLSCPEGGAVPTLLVRIPALVEMFLFPCQSLVSLVPGGMKLCSLVGPYCLNVDLI